MEYGGSRLVVGVVVGIVEGRQQGAGLDIAAAAGAYHKL